MKIIPGLLFPGLFPSDKPPVTTNLLLAEKPPVTTNPILDFYLAKKLEAEKYFKQDIKNIVYRPGVFEPGLVPNLFIAGKNEQKKQDVKKQRIEDAMKLSLLRIKFESRANRFIAKKKEVEKMPIATNNLLLAEKPPVTTNLLLPEEFAKEKEVVYAHTFVARRKRSYYDCNAFDELVAWGPKH